MRLDSCGAAVLPRGPAKRLVEPVRGRGGAVSPRFTSRGDARRDMLKNRPADDRAEGSPNRPGVDAARLRAVLSALMRRREELNSAARLPAEAARIGVPNAIRRRARSRGHLRIRPAGSSLAVARSRTRGGRPRGVARDDPAAVRVDLGALGSRARTRARARRRQPPAASGSSSSATADAAPARPGAGRDPALPRGRAVSRRRCSLRFLRWHSVAAEPVQAGEDVPFVAHDLSSSAMERKMPVRAPARRHDTSANTWRPFCSERCKVIDLGGWLSEENAIPGEAAEIPGADAPKDLTVTAELPLGISCGERRVALATRAKSRGGQKRQLANRAS